MTIDDNLLDDSQKDMIYSVRRSLDSLPLEGTEGISHSEVTSPINVEKINLLYSEYNRCFINHIHSLVLVN